MNKKSMAPYLFMAPYALLTLIFFVYPFFDAVRLAFVQTNGPRSEVFVGLANFAFVLKDPDFYVALKNTAFFAVASLCLQLPLSLLLAILLQNNKNKMAEWARLILFSPHLTGQIFVGIIFSSLFMPRYGLINQGLQNLVGWGIEKAWLQDPSLVMPAVVLTSLWMYVGFNMIYFLAALQNVDKTLVEAATIDGAGPWRIFRDVTLPAIKPVLVFVVLMSTIGSFNLFELPNTMLRGAGPNNSGLTIVGYLYGTAFNTGDLGTGAAIGWLLALIIFAAGLLQVRLNRADQTE